MNNVSFKERKAARIAARAANPNLRYKFRVVCDSYYIDAGIDCCVGTFDSRKAAEAFANDERHGYTDAWRAMAVRVGGRLPGGLPQSARFSIERIEA